VPPTGVVEVDDPLGDLEPGVGPGAESLPVDVSTLTVELNASAAALPSSQSTWPTDCTTLRRRQARPNAYAVYSPPRMLSCFVKF
jgi:hypothetical protein